MTWPWTALLAWGGGWATASVLLPVSAYLVDPSSPAAVFAAALVVGTPLLGAPIYVTARGTGARYPGVEATLWVVLLATIVVIFVRKAKSASSKRPVRSTSFRYM